MPNKCYKKLLQSIEVNFTLFNRLWTRRLFKYFILVETALKKFTLNLNFMACFISKLNGAKSCPIQRIK